MSTNWNRPDITIMVDSVKHQLTYLLIDLLTYWQYKLHHGWLIYSRQSLKLRGLHWDVFVFSDLEVRQTKLDKGIRHLYKRHHDWLYSARQPMEILQTCLSFLILRQRLALYVDNRGIIAHKSLFLFSGKWLFWLCLQLNRRISCDNDPFNEGIDCIISYYIYRRTISGFKIDEFRVITEINYGCVGSDIYLKSSL